MATAEEYIRHRFSDESQEWWHPENGETYLELWQRLLDHGLDAGEALYILEMAYGAAADEYGA